MPPQTASVVHRSRARVARRRLAGRRAAQRAAAASRCRSTRSTSARGGATPTSPTAPLTYRELADELADYVHRHGLHPRRAAAGDGAPVHRLVGLPGDRLLRARRRATARPTTSARSSTACTSAGIGVILDWVPAHFPRDDWALARFDGTALYEHEDPRRGAHPDWGTLVFNFGRNEVRNFLAGQRAVLAARVPRRRPARRRRRLDALPRLLAQGGRVDPQRVRRPRGPRGRRVPQGAQRGRSTRASRASSPRPRSRRRGRASRGRPTSAAWASASSGTWAGCTTRSATSQQDPVHRRYHHHELTFSLMYAFSENFILPLSHDEVVHGKGSLLDEDAGRPLAEARQPARAVRLHVGAPRQEAAVHGQRVRPGGASGATSARWTGTCSSDARATPACRRSCATSTASTATTPALWERDVDPRASAGSRPTTPTTTSSPSRAWAQGDADVAGLRRATSRRSRARATASACRAAGAGARSLNTDAERYGGSGIGNWRRRGRGRRRGTSQPHSAELDAAAARRALARARGQSPALRGAG